MIYSKISEFCESIELRINKIKTRITNINKKKILFLGTNIMRSRHVKYSGTEKKRQGRMLRFEAPIRKIRLKLASSGFMKKGKSHPRFI
jgi:hypothetical protein